ncbi:hypothetical protein ABC733_17500 [Mangrovibacter sp. SLW1]
MNNFQDIAILEVVASVDTNIKEDEDSYYGMFRFFSNKATQYSECGESEHANEAHTLAYITHMALDAHSTNEPIVPAIMLIDKRSISPADLQPQQRAFLDKLFPQIRTGLLKSRIAEIFLFLDKPRRWDLINEIIAGYLLEPLSEKRWYTSQQKLWTRALSLARQYRKKEPVAHIEEQIELYLDKHKPEDKGISLSLFRFIHEQHLLSTHAGKNAARLMALGTHEKANQNYNVAERVFFWPASFTDNITICRSTEQLCSKVLSAFFLMLKTVH